MTRLAIVFELPLGKIVTALLLVSAIFVAGCSSTTSSTSGYFGPSVSTATTKKEAASKSVATTKSDLKKARKELAAIERQAARDARRLKKRKLSKSQREKIETRQKKRKSTLKTAKRRVRDSQRAYDRALRNERRAARALDTAKRRKASAERRQETAGKTSTNSTLLAGFGLFSRSGYSSEYINDYGAKVDGGFQVDAIPVKKIDKRLLRQEVSYRSSHKAGTIVVDPRARYLYLIQPGGKAMRYGIGVGKAGFEWSGSAHIGWKQQWPKWTPPDEMIERRPDLAKWSADNGGMPGGPENPLGARALYLMQGNVDTLYRLHGTPEWDSIGTAASSGCIRLMNQDIIDLYKRVPHGAKVVVL